MKNIFAHNQIKQIKNEGKRNERKNKIEKKKKEEKINLHFYAFIYNKNNVSNWN